MKNEILKAGLKLWPNVTASSVAKALNVTHAAVIYHFPDVHTAVAEYAIKTRYLPVVVQLIASGHPACTVMSDEEMIGCIRDFIKSIKSQAAQ